MNRTKMVCGIFFFSCGMKGAPEQPVDWRNSWAKQQYGSLIGEHEIEFALVRQVHVLARLDKVCVYPHQIEKAQEKLKELECCFCQIRIRVGKCSQLSNYDKQYFSDIIGYELGRIEVCKNLLAGLVK